MVDPFSLAGKTILVTGASSGIGFAVSNALIEENAAVYVTSRNPNKLKDSMTKMSSVLGHMSADLTDSDAIDKLVDSVPLLNGVVLNSGILPPLRPISLETTENFRLVMETNFFAPVKLVQQLIKKKKLSNGCSIVFNTSIAVHTCPAASAAYSASKSALQAFSRSIALDLVKKKIRANCVVYGYVNTEILDGKISDEMIKSAPLGLATPEESVGPILFLLSDASRWITRINLISDSGLILHQARAV